MKTLQLNSNQFNVAVSLLQQGEVVGLPTETVYGLAADAMNPDAIQKIFIAKNRPTYHPLIVHISSIQDISVWAQNISPRILELTEAFWPGPLTLLCHKNVNASSMITGGLETIAIRMPNHPIILEIIDKLGNGIVAPSANLHKGISPTEAQHVLNSLKGKISAVLDGGACQLGLESTILDTTNDVYRILRPGPITKWMIEDTIKAKIEEPILHQMTVSGNMRDHYQPRTPLFLMSMGEILSECESNLEDFIILHYSALPLSCEKRKIAMPSQKEDYAKILYATLHKIDALNVKKIVVERPPNDAQWSDIHDRLYKASHKS